MVIPFHYRRILALLSLDETRARGTCTYLTTDSSSTSYYLANSARFYLRVDPTNSSLSSSTESTGLRATLGSRAHGKIELAQFTSNYKDNDDPVGELRVLFCMAIHDMYTQPAVCTCAASVYFTTFSNIWPYV